MIGAGHNNGPTLESGQRWRLHCWKKARADLLPNLPIEILRSRVKRAKELGLDYKTYASVRASTGRDVIGFLFSTNALRSFNKSPVIPDDRLQKLKAITDCDQIALVCAPLTPKTLLSVNPAAFVDAAQAPIFSDGWGVCRQQILSALRPKRLSADGVLLIGDTSLEREWAAAGKLAGYLPADRFFSAQAV